MISSIAGDMMGVPFEFNNIRAEEYNGELFLNKSTYSDDTVLEVATADSILSKSSYSDSYFKYASNYPNRGYGGMFLKMIKTGHLTPYDSYGNGSAMRAGPTGWIHNTLEETLNEAKRSSEVTHSHEEGIKGAQAVAASIFVARMGGSKSDIMKSVEKIGYNLSRKISDFRRTKFYVDCQNTIPVCMAIFNESDSFEDAMRKSIVMGGDVDTNCCIIGATCDAFYGLPDKHIQEEVYKRMPRTMANTVTTFIKKYIDSSFAEPDVKVGSKTATLSEQLESFF